MGAGAGGHLCHLPWLRLHLPGNRGVAGFWASRCHSANLMCCCTPTYSSKHLPCFGANSLLLPDSACSCRVGRLKDQMAEICVKAVLAVADLERRDVNLDLIKV